MNAKVDDLGARLAEVKGAKLIKSFCYTCPWQCPTEVLVRDGKIVYHKGNPESPNNIGSRCAKGMASSYLPRDPDRLKYPMLRTNPKGQPGQFKRISWDEAFTFVADKLKSIREKWGPEAVAYTCHHDPNTVFFRHLLGDLYGSPNNYTHTSGCEQDRRAACLTLFGHVFPMHDFANSRYVMLWGMNNLGANQGLWESRALIEAKKKGARLVVVDPNFTETAQKANEWVPIRPGTDGAMALAMCRVIVDEDLYDRDFVSRYCEGFDGLPRPPAREGIHAGVGRGHLRHRRGHHHPARTGVRPDQAFDVRDLQGLGLLHERGGRRRAPATSLTPSVARWTSRAT